MARLLLVQLSGVRAPPTPSRGPPRKCCGASLAEIGLLCAATGVLKVHPHHCTFSHLDFLAAVVADEDRLSGQFGPPIDASGGQPL